MQSPARAARTVSYPFEKGRHGKVHATQRRNVIEIEGKLGSRRRDGCTEIDETSDRGGLEIGRRHAGDGIDPRGLGMSREVRLLDGEGVYSVQSDRAVIPPFGVAGGGSGAPNRFTVLRDGRRCEGPAVGRAGQGGRLRTCAR